MASTSRAGSANRNKERLFKALQSEYGEMFSPIMKMAEHATAIHEYAVSVEERIKEIEEAIVIAEDTGAEIAAEMLEKVLAKITLVSARMTSMEAWEKIAPYIDYKLKAIEHSGEIELTDLRDKTDQQLKNRLQELTHAGSEQRTDDRIH